MPQSNVLTLHAFLDTKTEGMIRHIWEQAATMGIELEHAPEGVRPHLTFGSWLVSDIPPGFIVKKVGALAGLPPITLRMQIQLGVRDLVHFHLAPIVQHDLLTFHEHVHKQLGDMGKRYRPTDIPGQWAPHVSLFACREENALAALTFVKFLPVPLAAELKEMGFVMYGPGKVEKVASFELAGGK